METKRRRANHLIDETSPYLLQHAHNPVDWHPWNSGALLRARAEDKPIFLSIGYSACHWCHVMEKESFEDENTAGLLNEHFVCIKVDREERPELDDIYMKAVQLMTGGGGWPLNVFLTPDLEPFYGGAYFPPQDLFGRPSFRAVLAGIARAWRERRDNLIANAKQVTEYIGKSIEEATGNNGTSFDLLMNKATDDLAGSFDRNYGGFGGAPKFPPSHAIALLLRQHSYGGDSRFREMAEQTLTHMARGGLYDHLGGGFHRYSVDERWLVPHFEKMLYDNALLSEVYIEAYQVTANPLYRHVIEDTFEYVLRDMRGSGAFYSSEDADSEGQEGKFYLWTYDEIMSVLGEDDGILFCAYYGVRKQGNFSSHEAYHAGLNILHVPRPPDAVSEEFGLSAAELQSRLATMRVRLLEVRGRRTRPDRDDKVITSWNGLMIGALAKGFQVLGDPRYREAAEQAAGFIIKEMLHDSVLLHTHRNGKSRFPGYLDDYVFLANGLLDLYEATFEPRWFAAAETLMRLARDKFWDAADGGFYSTSSEHKDVLVRMKPMFDGAEPSGNSAAAFALLRLAGFTGNADYLEKAERTVRTVCDSLPNMPHAFLRTLCAIDFFIRPAKEIAIIGDPTAQATQALIQAVREHYVPNRVVALLDPTRADADLVAETIPLLAGKMMKEGRPTAYVCQDFACRQPVNTPEGLLKELFL